MGAGDAGRRGFADARARACAAAARLAAQGRDAGERAVSQLRAGFVDLPSIVAREPGSCLWIARHQFETTFLLPLVASVEAGLPIAWTLSNPVAGLSHESLAGILGARRWLKPRLWRRVALPAALAAQAAAGGGAPRAMKVASEEQARYILERSLRGLERQVGRCVDEARGPQLPLASLHGDTQPLRQRGPRGQAHVRDRGDRGHAAAPHARHRRQHRRIQRDRGEPGRRRRARHRRALGCGDLARAREGKLPILPLVGNFGRPTPALGWRNREQESLLGRAAGSFDLVLMLAVVHHLRVTEGVPVAEQFDAVAAITRRHLLVEYVPVTDPMFAAIARGREPLYPDCLRPEFEATLLQRFQIERKHELPNGRVLYLARRRLA